MRGRKTLLLAALVSILPAALSGCSKKSSPTPFIKEDRGAAQENSPAPPLVVQLKDAKFNETLRLIERDEHTGLNRRMRIEWRGGLTCLVDCDDLGRPRRATIYYPKAEAAKGGSKSDVEDLGSQPFLVTDRAVYRKILFQADGSTLAEDTLYFKDQTIKEIMVRSGADMVVTCYARESRVEAVRTYDGKTGRLIGEMVFSKANRRDSLLVKEGAARARRDIFNEDGSRKLSFVYDEEKVVEVLLWHDDGVTLLEKLTRGYSSTTSTVYENGKAICRRSKQSDGSMQVVHFDASGKESFKQTWKVLPDSLPADKQGVVSDGYYLAAVEDLLASADGKKRDVEFYPGGKSVRKVRIFMTSNWSPYEDKTFDEDGTLTAYTSYGEPQYTTVDLLPSLTEEARKVQAKDDGDALVAAEKLVPAGLSPIATIESFNPPPRGKERSPAFKLD
ncbi:MAG: hypothetical protein J0M35_17030 [Candidatus Obscuribacter phosphatis]|uniref:Lipoprotein n=1 Tax=Candidatus Obscuribacter phosphatis TaxID=1906157 RepID=A0A8J7P9F4_9BACT|nr:hypothetical protein [Candidatus Obscuribacter phosphatis]